MAVPSSSTESRMSGVVQLDSANRSVSTESLVEPVWVARYAILRGTKMELYKSQADVSEETEEEENKRVTLMFTFLLVE
jgi:hypothetical protein